MLVEEILRLFDKAIDAEAELIDSEADDPLKHFRRKQKIRKIYERELRIMFGDSP